MAPNPASPVDHGWAWMVVLGAHIVNFLLIGGYKSLGILFVELRNTFEASAAVTAILIGLIGGGMSLVAPLGTAVGERIGHRRVVIFGGLLCASGSFLTAFAPSIVYVVTIYGLLMGFGYGCQLSPAMVMVGKYFSRRRSFANGLAFAGGSMGTLLIPLLMRYITDLYGFRGALIIFSGCLLHMCIGGALFRPITFANTRSRKPIVRSQSGISKGPPKSAGCELCLESHGLRNTTVAARKIPSVPETTTSLDDVRYTNGTQDHKKSVVKSSVSMSSLKNAAHRSLHSLQRSLGTIPVCECTCHKLDPYDTSHIIDSTGSLYFVPLQDSPSSIRNIHEAIGLETHEEEEELTSQGTFCQSFRASFICCNRTVRDVKPLFDWSILANIQFIFYVLGIMLGNAGYVNCFLFLPPYAADLGLTKKTASIFLAVGGVSDLIGRIFGGWFADLNIVKRYNLMGFCMMVTALTTIISPFFPSIYAVAAIILSVGFFGGFYIALMAVILVDFIGLEKMPNGFGLTVMVMGLFNTFVPSILGLLKDVTGEFGLVFQVCGMLMLICSMLFLASPIAKKLEIKRIQKKYMAAPEEKY